MKVLFILTLMSLSFIVNSNEFLEDYKVINDKVILKENDDITKKYNVNYETITFKTNAPINDKIILAESIKNPVNLENKKIEKVITEKNNIDEVDVLLNEATTQISNKEIIKNYSSKFQTDHNELLLNKIKDLENRVLKLESLLENKIEEI